MDADSAPDGKRRRRRNSVSIAGVPVEIAKKGDYAARASLIAEDDWRLLNFLFQVRLATRAQLLDMLDPVALRYDFLPESVRPEMSAAERARRRQRTRNRRDRALLRSAGNRARGFPGLQMVEVQRQHASQGEDKARALARSDGEIIRGRRADIVHLSRDGLRYVKDRLELDSADPPTYGYFERVHARVAHHLVAADLLIELSAFQELGLIEVVSFAVEYSWLEELSLEADESSRAARRGLRSDVVVTVAPHGRPDLAETIAVEVDRGTQSYKRPYPGQNPTAHLPFKLQRYWTLAKRLRELARGEPAPATVVPERLKLAFVVPAHSRIKAPTRARALRRLFDEEQARQERLGDGDLVSIVLPEDPSPANFVAGIASYMEAKARLAAPAGREESDE